MQPPQHQPYHPDTPWWARNIDVMSEVRPDWRDLVPPWENGMQQAVIEAHVRNLVSEQRKHAMVNVARLDEMRPTYEVPGRREDGTPAGRRRLARAAVVVVRPVRNLILSILGLTVGLLLENPTIVTSKRFHRVRGHEGCQALAFLTPFGGTPWTITIEPLWLVWSNQQAALFRLPDHDPEKLELVWAGETTATVPHVDVRARTLSWRDGSSIVLDHKHVSATLFDEAPGSHPHNRSTGRKPPGGQQ